jgi:O-antigen ligase
VIVPIVAFAAALAVGLRWDRQGLRWLVVVAVVLAPLRGGLLALGDEVGLGNSGLAINALVPALVAALTIGVAIRLRPRLDELPRLLLVGWGLIAAVAVLNLPVQDVGLKLYGVGLAQYLVYPTLAIAAWPLYERGDLEKLSRLFIAMGLVVAVTVLIQATGIESFIQSASAEVEGLAANRYAGITGSYLHTSAFLGVAAVLIMGEILRLESSRSRVIGSALLAVVLCGEILTFSRSGIVIAGLGFLSLLVLVAAGRRLSFAAVVIPAAIVALVIGAIGGVGPGAAGARVSSGFDPSGDKGNSLRSEAFGEGIDRFRENSIAHETLGEGLGSTGNARKLVSGEVFTVESYYLKLLVETGVVGTIAIGGFLVWAAFVFARILWLRRRPWIASVAAAGLGLSLYNAIYPALETQVLALVWWLLLALCLRADADDEPVEEDEADRAEVAPQRDPVLVNP